MYLGNQIYNREEPTLLLVLLLYTDPKCGVQLHQGGFAYAVDTTG
jgi:hypothetical protein